MTTGEFDVEAMEEDGGGNVTVKPASPLPPQPPPQEEAAPAATSAPDEPREPRNKGGRPRKNPAAAAQQTGTLPGAPPPVASSEPYPKKLNDLWVRLLADAQAEGRTADEFVMYVYRLAGPQLQPMRLPERIWGEQVAGDPEQGLNPGDAIIDWLTDYFHMGMVTTSASYRVEFYWRANGHKIVMSDPWPLDAPHNIDKLRRRLQQASGEKGGQQFYGAPPPRRPYYPPQPPPPPVYQQPQPAHDPAAPQPAAPAPAAPTMPRTGDPYMDRILDMQDEQRRIDRAEAQRREEEQRVMFEKREAEMRAQLDEMRQLHAQQVQPPLPVQPVATASPQPVESEEVKQAKLAATISQAVMQTLIASGVVKPPGQAAPTTSEAQQAAGTLKNSADTMESFFDQMERLEKMTAKARRAFGLPSEEEQRERDEREEEPDETKEKVVKMRSLGGIMLPQYDPEDDEPGNLQRVLDFFTANPEVTKGIAGQALQLFMSKFTPEMAQRLLGGVMALGGNPAAAAGALAAATNGASHGAPVA